MLSVFGSQRVAVLAREITKLYETIRQLPLGELTEWVRTHPEQQKGESVIMLAGATPAPDQQKVELAVDDLLTSLLTKLSVKDAANMASHLTGLGKNQLYARALEIQQQSKD